MDSDSAQIVQLLDATLDHTKGKAAEAELKQLEKKPQFSLLLLKIVHSDDLPTNTRLSAALCFKNFLKFNYVTASGNYKLPEDEVATIKRELIGLMISAPPPVQTQLGDAISVIAESDFWERWDTLVPELVSRFSENDAKVNNGVLEVAHAIFVRWRPLFPSDDLFNEINHVLNNFATPFLHLMNATDARITEYSGDPSAVKGYFKTMVLLIKVFYDLSCQDMPPQFEATLPHISGILHKYLTYKNPLLETDDDEETGMLEHIKADICDVLQLYCSKYDEDFKHFTPVFIKSAWDVLSSIGPEPKFDNLVSKALQFLTAVAGNPEHAKMFNNEDTLNQVVEKAVLPNVALRATDIEMFEEEPIEFIRRDLEGADTDSRRRAATDFLRTLQESHEALVTGVAGKYIAHYLETGKTSWTDKDTAVSLFLAIAAKGAVTAAQGVKTVNSLVNVVEFFQQHIASDLISDVHPIPKVNAIKYLYTFRSQLTKEQWEAAFPPLIQNMASSNYVVYTYAAIAVERVLYLTDDKGDHVLSRADIAALAKDLLQHLFKLVERDEKPAKMQENEFLMRCIMRVLIVMKDGVLPFLDLILDHLIGITDVIKKNPSNPRFYYYHFEALGALVKYGSPEATSKLEERLWQPLQAILTQGVNEFCPYVFQIFAALLEPNPSGALPIHYKALIGPLLAPGAWETRGHVPGCTRLLSAIIPRATVKILANKQLEPILVIFQTLLSGSKTDSYAFDLLESIIISFPKAKLETYFRTIVELLLRKLDRSPAESYKKRFVRFYHLVSARTEAGFGADWFITQAHAIQSDIFTPLYLKTILPVSKLLMTPIDRKLAVVSFAKTLAHSQAFAQRYAKGWGYTCETMLEMLANAPKVSTRAGDEVVENDVDDIGFGMGFTPLNTCKLPARDDFTDIQDVPVWVRQYLTEANAQQGGIIARFVQERLSPEGQHAFSTCMA